MKFNIATFALVTLLAISGLAHAKGGPKGPLGTAPGWQCAGKKIPITKEMNKAIAETAKLMEIPDCTFAGSSNVRVLMACQGAQETRYNINMYGIALFKCPNATEPGSYWYAVPTSVPILKNVSSTPPTDPTLENSQGSGCGKCEFCLEICFPWIGCTGCACTPNPVCWIEDLAKRLSGLASDYWNVASNWVSDAAGAAYTFVTAKGKDIVNDISACVQNPASQWDKCAKYVSCLNIVSTGGDPFSQAYWEKTADQVIKEIEQCADLSKPEMCQKYASCLFKLI